MSFENVLKTVIEFEGYKNNYFKEEVVQSQNLLKLVKQDFNNELMSEKSELVKKFQILNPIKQKKLTK